MKIILYIIVLILLAIIPFFASSISTGFKEKLELSFHILTTVSILTGAVLALIFFDPLGVRKKRLEKQYDKVTAVLEFISEGYINYKAYDKETNLHQYGNSYLRSSDVEYLMADRLLMDLPVRLYISEYYRQFQTLFDLKRNVWTPITVAQKIEMLELLPASGVTTDADHNKHIILTWKPAPSEDDTLCDEFKGEILTFLEFLKRYREVTSECEKWLKANSFYNSSLNI